MRSNAGPNHPWRQYPNRRRAGTAPPTLREKQVAEIMATECDEVPHVVPGRKYQGPRLTAERIAEQLGLNPANVRNVQARIRARLGDQAR